MTRRKANPLKHTLAFRVSQSDYEALTIEAATSGMSRSEYLRDLLKSTVNE